MAFLSSQLGIDSFRTVVKWVSVSSRLSALGLVQMPTSKWKWKSLTDLVKSDGDLASRDKDLPLERGLLKKREFGEFVEQRERGFNLDLFDLIRSRYGLVHPLLQKVEKAGHSQVKRQNLELNSSEVDFRIKGIHRWLDQITKDYDHKRLPDQMMSMIRSSGTGEIFRKTQVDKTNVMVAGESKNSTSGLYGDIN